MAEEIKKEVEMKVNWRVNRLAPESRLGTINPEPKEYNFYLRHGRVVRKSVPAKPRFWWGQIIESKLNGFYDTISEKGRWWIEITVTSPEPRGGERIIRTKEVPTIVEMEGGWLAARIAEIGKTVIIDARRLEKAIRRAGVLLVDGERYKPVRVRKLRVGEPQEMFPEEINESLKKITKSIINSDKVRELKELANKVPKYFLQEVTTNKDFKKNVSRFSERRAREIAERIIRSYGRTWYVHGPIEKPVKVRATGKIVFKNGMFNGVVNC
ncbi:MAG: hypothetical protein AB7D08_03505 [Bacteroidales bacterium]|jgi:hypothetical protein